MNQTNTSEIDQTNIRLKQVATQRIAFVQACWHEKLVNQIKLSFVNKLNTFGITRQNVDIYRVAGSLEIPLQVKLLAKTGKYAVVVAAGLVVNGGIYRHEFVSQSVINGMMRVQLETEVPVLSAVLTPLNFHEHDEHTNFFYAHLKTKGEEAAAACLQTLENLSRLRSLA